MRVPSALHGLVLLVGLLLSSFAQADSIIVASTTSTANSGLFDAILPKFEAASGIKVKVVAVGTGQAIRLARNGDADVLLVHHRPSEEKFVADGHGVSRMDLMYNDFVLVGPKADPAGIRGCASAAVAMEKIARTASIFASRGDDSGTHKRELSLWKGAGVDVEAAGGWYRATGSGMGATLNTAAAMDGYTLADRGTWLSFKNRQGLEVLCEKDQALFNPYGIILVNPARHPHVKAEAGQAFIDWMTSAPGQQAIADYRINGQQLFVPGGVARASH